MSSLQSLIADLTANNGKHAGMHMMSQTGKHASYACIHSLFLPICSLFLHHAGKNASAYPPIHAIAHASNTLGQA